MLLFILLSPALSYDQMRVQHAQRLMDFHQFWNAYQQLTSVISQETGKIDNKLYRLRAQCCLNMAMTREALEDARKIIKNNPSKDDENYAYTVEARANIQKGNFAEARAAAEKAGDKQLVRNCEQLRSYEVTAKAKIDQGQIGEAGQILDTLIRNAPKAMKIMYERAYRYLLGMKHRNDDLPYPSGPALKSDEPFKKTSAIWDYKLFGRSDEIADYGYDEQLQYYIYPNGQCQESSRDQGHVLAGLHNYVAIAEMAWNQGDSLYSCLDNRILLGLEWSYRYNLSSVRSYPDQLKPWEPVYVTTDISEVSYENNKYLSILSRSGRWRSMSISAHGRGDGAKSGGTREMALAHYSVRANVDSIKYKWLERYRDHMIEKYGMEDWGVAPNWFYEWTGWGTLTKRLTPWMAGDPGKFKNREHISGINQLPGVINVVDYDYYCKSENPEGHTCHNSNKKNVVNDYRPDGNVEISKDGDDYVVLNIQDGEWMNYTVSVPETADYKVFLSYSCEGSANVTLVSDQGTSTGKCLINKNNYNDIEVSKIHLNAGACVLRLIINETSNNLKIKRLKIVK